MYENESQQLNEKTKKKKDEEKKLKKEEEEKIEEDSDELDDADKPWNTMLDEEQPFDDMLPPPALQLLVTYFR